MNPSTTTKNFSLGRTVITATAQSCLDATDVLGLCRAMRAATGAIFQRRIAPIMNVR